MAKLVITLKPGTDATMKSKLLDNIKRSFPGNGGLNLVEKKDGIIEVDCSNIPAPTATVNYQDYLVGVIAAWKMIQSVEVQPI